MLAHVAMVLLALLVASMLFEVVMRYGFNAPTKWAFDISYMLNGSVFFLAIGYTFKKDTHIRIDIFSSMLPPVWESRLLGFVILFLLVPVSGRLAYTAVLKAWSAYLTGAVEEVSPWAPYVWPFYSAIALGLVVMTLQCIVYGSTRLFARDPRQDSDSTWN